MYIYIYIYREREITSYLVGPVGHVLVPDERARRPGVLLTPRGVDIRIAVGLDADA